VNSKGCKVITYTGDWIGLCSVLRPRQHSIGYMGDKKEIQSAIMHLNGQLLCTKMKYIMSPAQKLSSTY